jgi:hypothetical protein
MGRFWHSVFFKNSFAWILSPLVERFIVCASRALRVVWVVQLACVGLTALPVS